MRRPLAIGLLVAAVGGGLGARPMSAAQRTAGLPPSGQLPSGAGRGASAGSSATTAFFDELLAAYAAGDFDVLSKRLTSFQSQLDFDKALTLTLGKKDDPKNQPVWTRARAAFFLEIAVFSSSHYQPDVIPSLSAGRLYVMSRPARLGLNPDEDAFELQWHRTALALLQRRLDGDVAQVYLDTLERRYLSRPEAHTSGTRLDPRFVLDRVIAYEQSAFRLESQGQTATTRLAVLAKPTDKTPLGKTLQQGLVASADAISLDDVAVEAGIRRASLLMKTGQFDEALQQLRKVNPVDADQLQRYWAQLLEARALHELKRLPDAEQAYREAGAMWPDAPSPLVGMALVQFDMNRREDAAATSASARELSKSAVGPDPWWNYIAADGRFIGRWLAALRGMVK